MIVSRSPQFTCHCFVTGIKMNKVLYFSAVLPVLLAVLCRLPENPTEIPSNASATITMVNNAGPVSLNEVTAGVPVVIGYSLYLPDFVDSVMIVIVSSKQKPEAFYVAKAPWEAGTNTIPVTFPVAGTKTCILTCFKSDGTTSDAEQIFVVSYRLGNRAPQWYPDTVELSSQQGVAETRNLMPFAGDPDQNLVTLTVDAPNGLFMVQDSLVTAGTALETGPYVLKIYLTDGELSDTGTVIWRVFAASGVHAVVADDTVGTVVDSRITVDVLANDMIPSGAMMLSSVTQPVNGIAAIKNNKVIYIPSSGFSGVDLFSYVVNGMDTGNVTVTVTVDTISAASDTTAPIIHLVLPQSDSTSVNGSSATVSIEAADESGIASVTASYGDAALQVSVASPVYSVTLSSLTANQYATVRFIATDASAIGNAETLYVTVKYDPSISDATGPVITQLSGPVSNSVITDPLVAITVSVTDPGGVDSVFLQVNRGPAKLLTPVPGNADQFSLSETMTREHLDTIIISAVDRSPRRNRSTWTVILNYIIPPAITVQPNGQTACAGTPVSFSVTATGTEPLSYQWRKGTSGNLADIPAANKALYEFSPVAADNGMLYSCRVGNGGDSVVVSEPVTLTVNSASTKPTAAATPVTICSGESSVLSVSGGTLGTGAAWKWYTNKNSSTAIPSLTVSPMSGCWYYVKGTASLCGDSPWDSIYITVNSKSTAPTGINASTATVCSGGEVTLSQNGGTLGTGATWQWFTDAACTQPASGTPSGDGSQITVKPASTITYYLQAVGTCNTTTAVSKTVTVSSPSNAPTSIAANSSSVCPGSSITLTESGGSLGTGAAWKWYTNSACTQAASGSLNADGSQLTVTPSAQTTYYVRAESAVCGNTSAASRTIAVNTPPSITSQLVGQEVCEPDEYESVDYSISATGNSPLSYEWFTSGGTRLGTGSSIYVPAPTAGTTQFYCVVTDVNGCSTRSNTATQTAYQPTVITRQPAGDIGYIEFGDRWEDTVMATGSGLSYEWQCQQPNGSSWVMMGTGTTISISAYDIPGWDPYELHNQGLNIYEVPVRVKITNQFGCEKLSNTLQFKVYQ